MTEQKRQDFRSFLLGMLVNKVPRHIIDDIFVKLKEDLVTLAKFNCKVDNFRNDLGGEQPQGTQALDISLSEWKQQKFLAVMRDFCEQVAKLVNEHAPGHAFTSEEAQGFLMGLMTDADLPFTEMSAEADTPSD